MKTTILAICAVMAMASFAVAEVGVAPIDLNGKTLQGGAFSGIWSATPGTKGTASYTITGKSGLFFQCTQGATSGTAATVKVGRNGSLSTYYHASSGTLYFGKGTGTTSVTFGSYSTANTNVCAGYYW